MNYKQMRSVVRGKIIFFIPYLTQADFYLFHNVCEMNIDAYLDEKYRIFPYLVEQKKRGVSGVWGFPPMEAWR